jgi:hypothetical protein
MYVYFEFTVPLKAYSEVKFFQISIFIVVIILRCCPTMAKIFQHCCPQRRKMIGDVAYVTMQITFLRCCLQRGKEL